MSDAEYYKQREIQLIEKYKNSDIGENTIEEMIKILKQDGCNPMETMILLDEIKGISLGEAKIRVSFSEHWSEIKRSEEELKEALEKYKQHNKRVDEYIDQEAKKGFGFWRNWKFW